MLEKLDAVASGGQLRRVGDLVPGFPPGLRFSVAILSTYVLTKMGTSASAASTMELTPQCEMKQRIDCEVSGAKKQRGLEAYSPGDSTRRPG